MTQTISAERIEEMLAGLEGPVGAAVIRGDDLADVRTAMTLALSALRAQAQGSEAVAPHRLLKDALFAVRKTGAVSAEYGGVLVDDKGGMAYVTYEVRPATPPAPIDGWGDPQEIERVEAEVKTLLAAPVDGGVTDAMIDAGLSEYSEGGCSGLDQRERREVVTSILTAALTASRAAVAQEGK